MTTLDITSVADSKTIFEFFRDAYTSDLLNLRLDQESETLTVEDKADFQRFMKDLFTQKPIPSVSDDPQDAISLLQWFYHVDVAVSRWLPSYRASRLSVSVVLNELNTLLPEELQISDFGRSWNDARLAMLENLYRSQVDEIRVDYCSDAAIHPSNFSDLAEWLYVRSWLKELTGSTHGAWSLINQQQKYLNMTQLGAHLVKAIETTEAPVEAMNSFYVEVEEKWDAKSAICAY